MKRQYVQLLIVVFLLSGFISSQANAQSLLVGAKAGLNYSSIAKDYFKTYDFRTGSTYGIFGELSLPDLPVSFTVEVHYATIGANNVDPEDIYYDFELEDGRPLSLISESNLSFKSLEVPVIINYNLPLAEDLHPKLYAGFVYDYILKIGDNAESINEKPLSYEYIDKRKSVADYGALLGIGGYYDISMLSITYDIRYSMGYSDLLNARNISKLTSHSWQAMVGVGYKLDL